MLGVYLGKAKGMEAEEAEYELEGMKRKMPNDSLCVCEVVSFRVLSLAISQLWPEDVPNRADFEVKFLEARNLA